GTPPCVECASRFWYDARQDLNARVQIDTWRQRHDLQRRHGSGHYLAPEGAADLLSGLEAPICPWRCRWECHDYCAASSTTTAHSGFTVRTTLVENAAYYCGYSHGTCCPRRCSHRTGPLDAASWWNATT